ncbi:flagellin [Tateyamaria sp. Alg231-49]|uniref:flagellin n=1 Tax=Tateyamaria sp. Alg231-49 TaxID=1922219 RepID=UPI000D556E18|nr:flagellin [Tateyamaria sp. Alg231-49]
MNSFSLGDLAHSFMLQRRGAELQAEFSRVTEEVASGQVSDIKSVLAGNTGYLIDIENNLQALTSYAVATVEAAQLADATQAVLELVNTSVEQLNSVLVAMPSSAQGAILDQFSNDAEIEMATIVSALNTTSGGRSVFAGLATDRSALEGVGVILDALRAATATATTPDELKTLAEQWFDDPLGFTAVAYTGTDEALAPFRVGDNETVSVNVTANDSALRDILMNVSVAVISKDEAFGFSTIERQDLLRDSGEGLFQVQTDLTAIRASVGFAQARIDAVSTRNATEENGLLIARAALLQVDPFEAASELEAVQFQLQSLYTVAARMSDMSFVNFIR